MIKCLENIPEKWKVGRVKDIFYISKDKAHQKDPVILSLSRDGIKVRDISNNEGQIAESYENYNPVKPGDLLLNPMDLYSGANCNMSLVEGVISPAYVNLRKKYKNISPKFYDYYFKVQYWTMNMFAHGKGVSFDNRWTLNTEGVLNFEIPILSGEEQQKIADFLDKKCSQIERLIKLQDNEIEKLKEYKQSIISETITKDFDSADLIETGMSWIEKIPSHWSIVPIKTLFTFGKGLPITKENLTESGVNVISYGQVHSKTNACVRVDDSLYRFVSEDYLHSNPECLVKKGDFIFADTSEDVAGTGDFVHIDNNITTFAGYHSIILKNKNKYNSKYLAYQFMTDNWRHQIRSKVSGVKLFSLTKKILGQAMVIIPSKEEQDAVVNKLESKCDKIDKLIQTKKDKIEKLADYKKSLIYECVTGKKEI